MGNKESIISNTYEGLPNRNYNMMCIYDLKKEEIRVLKWNKRSQLFFPPDPDFDKIPQQQFLAPNIKLTYKPLTFRSDEYKSFITNASDHCIYPVPTDLCIEIEMYKHKFLLRIALLGTLVVDGKLNIISRPILPPLDLSKKFRYPTNGLYICWKKQFITYDSDELRIKWHDFIDLLSKESQFQNLKLFETICPDIFINGKWPYVSKPPVISDLINQESIISRKLSVNESDNQLADPE